jgi:hypothetical protein
MTVYVIIRGLKSCSDCDELKGYKASEEEARRYCDEQQALDQDRLWWSWDVLELIA